jgi:cation transport ATPase
MKYAAKSLRALLVLVTSGRNWIPGIAASAIVLGGVMRVTSSPTLTAEWIWTAALALTGLPIVVATTREVIRGKFAADLVATLTVVLALILGHPVVGLVIVVMQTGGEALERFAAGRASNALRSLEENAPRRAHRIEDGITEDVDTSEISAGDVILIRPGELIPCDGIVLSGSSHVDTSTLTGEPLPREASQGSVLMSGGLNQ